VKNSICKANPAGRWTVNDRGVGVSYVIVTQGLNRNKLQSPIVPLFEIKGAPLYDFRKDTTVGGSGSHRWDTQSTWEFSENPVLMEYALERGFFNGTQKMVGKGVNASRLPVAKWSLAANIADENVGSPATKRYRAALIANDGSNSTHDANMTPLLEAMAGSWVELVDVEYPIAGAEQAVAFTITDTDLVRGEGLRFTAKTPRSELINTVSAKYPSPAKFYETVSATQRNLTDALAEDGELLASAIEYDAVTYSVQVDRLADIALRAARYQASADVCILPQWRDSG